MSTRTGNAWRTGKVVAVLACVLVCVLAVAACAPRLQPPGPGAPAPDLTDTTFTTTDGQALPVRIWRAAGDETAVFVAVHGYGDYSNAFAMPAPWWAERGITTYAYDQRGFGRSPHHGVWAGVDRLTGDLRTFVDLVHRRHPDRPLFVVGVSMGGAVAMTAFAGGQAQAQDQDQDQTQGQAQARGPVDGLVLVAPAVWGRVTMNPFYRATLWLSVRLFPGGIVDGRGLNLWPSDNVEMLRALGRDPLTYKNSRIDTVYGLVNLMDAALDSAARQTLPTLLLYGAKDRIIPPEPVEIMRGRLTAPYRVALYPDGWHMLLRDLQAATVWRDVAAWTANTGAPLPSGHEHNGGPLFAGR